MNPKYPAMFTLINILLGVGPLIIPAPFFQAGVLLSTLWMIIVVGLSYIAGMYIIESMAKVSDLMYKSKNSLISSVSSIETENSHKNERKLKQADPQNDTLLAVEKEPLPVLDHVQQITYLYGSNLKFLPTLAIIIYLTGTSISKCIMTGKTLSEVFEHVNVLSSFYFWLGIFFLSGAIFSFRSIQKTMALQITIVSVRLISFILMIGGAIYLIIHRGMREITPKNGGIFNASYFSEIFSNSMFSLLCHHSLPSIASPITNSSDADSFLKASIFFSGFINILIPWTAVMAFGEDLGGSGDEGSLKYYNFDFKPQLPLVFYFVSFYVFLNIAAFSVYIIVVRANILKLAGSKVNPKILNKTTALTTLILLSFVLLISYLLQNEIQYVLDFTGGIFGAIIMFMLPCMEVLRSRKRQEKPGKINNYFKRLPYLVMLIGALTTGFNLYELVKKLV